MSTKINWFGVQKVLSRPHLESMLAMAILEPQEEGYATADEAAQALARLSDANLLRIERFARIRATGLRPWDWEDLIHEAVARVLSGSRRWPKAIPLTVFLRQTIRSLAHEERRRRIQAGGSFEDADEEARAIGDDAPGPERAIAAREALATLLSRFEGDTMVLTLIEGLAQGETAAETCDRAEMTRQKYDAARKRFRRSVDAWQKDDEARNG
jgi:DNA-directed RNA polymerase specialized sigma24 family protein